MIQEYLFHGTSTAYLDQMLQDGLRPESSYKGYLCYSDDIGIAQYHAHFMAAWDSKFVGRRCEPIMFRIPGYRFSVDSFCLDENFISLGASAGRAVGLDLSKIGKDWRELLTVAGSVGYQLLMPVSREDVFEVMA